jgi:DNA-binding phage protein
MKIKEKELRHRMIDADIKSIAELARKARVSRITIEKGFEENIEFKSLRKIAGALKISDITEIMSLVELEEL